MKLKCFIVGLGVCFSSLLFVEDVEAQNWTGNTEQYRRAVEKTCKRCICEYSGICSMYREYACFEWQDVYSCKPGWKHNGDKNCSIPVCEPKCNTRIRDAVCIAPGKCDCKGQAYGDLCENGILADSTTQRTTWISSTTPVADSTTQRTSLFSSTTPVTDSTAQSTTEINSTTQDDNQSKIIIGVVSGLVTGLLCFIAGIFIGMICQRRKDKTRASKQGSDYLTPISPSGVSPATPSYVNADFRMTGNNSTVTTYTPNQEIGPYMELQLGLREQPDNYESLTSN